MRERSKSRGFKERAPVLPFCFWRDQPFSPSTCFFSTKFIFTFHEPVGKRQRCRAKGERQRRQRRSNIRDSTDVLVGDAAWPRPVVFQFITRAASTGPGRGILLRFFVFYRYITTTTCIGDGFTSPDPRTSAHTLTSHNISTNNRFPVPSRSAVCRVHSGPHCQSYDDGVAIPRKNVSIEGMTHEYYTLCIHVYVCMAGKRRRRAEITKARFVIIYERRRSSDNPVTARKENLFRP